MTHQFAADCVPRSCPVDRRALLLTVGLAATATATLGGCGTEPESSVAAPPAGEAAKPSAAEASASTAGASPSAAGAAPPGVAIPTGALTLAAHVPVGGGVVVEGGKVLVVQLSGGVFKAYDAQCPHKGVPVNPPDAEGVVQCPRHNAKFKAADGSLVKGPAERGLSGIPVKVDGEYVVRA